ncbi:hypothetical protein M408DRAFT_334052 [Serendipita vermifera MAFF 305830]|uniref:Uncharacterized protein n=1 Tax=Serendipita vermifera MAFF 305830 TaxID=933852 RepID=A0A0C3ALX4_SERVB|nr:hypothetical protein M408DRAFT_334052 [Serendipita vermifera MAFF 305830]
MRNLLFLFFLSVFSLTLALPVPTSGDVKPVHLVKVRASPNEALDVSALVNTNVEPVGAHELSAFHKRQTAGARWADGIIGMVNIFKDPGFQAGARRVFKKIGSDFKKAHDRDVAKWKSGAPLHPGH